MLALLLPLLLLQWPCLVAGFLAGHRLQAQGSRLGGWLSDLLKLDPEPSAAASTTEDKSFVFDGAVAADANSKSTPEYLLSALLAGLNILPPEEKLRRGSQRGRRVQYESYSRQALNWAAFQHDRQEEFSSSSSASVNRLIESQSLSSNEDVLQQGTLRVYKFQLTDVDATEVNREILAQLGSFKASNDEGMKVSNAGGYHSLTNCFQDGANARLAGLCDAAAAHVEGAESLFGGHGDGNNNKRELQSSQESEAWVNCNSHGHWNSLHTHTGAAWSGIYYCKVPTPTVVSSVFYHGNLLIKPSPHTTEKSSLSALESRRLNLRPMPMAQVQRCDYAEIAPVAGMLLLIPSYLQHAVLPLSILPRFRGTECSERVSLAFNLVPVPVPVL